MNRRRFFQSSLAAAVAASLPVERSLATLLAASLRIDADVNAIAGDGGEVTVKRAAVQELADSLQGNFPRLVELKNRYDPTNLFRLNANVQPTA